MIARCCLEYWHSARIRFNSYAIYTVASPSTEQAT